MTLVGTRKCGLGGVFVFLILPTVPVILGGQRKDAPPPPKGRAAPEVRAPANTRKPAPDPPSGTNTRSTGAPSTRAAYFPPRPNGAASQQSNSGTRGQADSGAPARTRPLPGTMPARVNPSYSAAPATRRFTDRAGRPVTASYRPGGRLATIHAAGMTINHGIRGERTVVSRRDGQTIVSTGTGSGYVQQAYLMRNGQQYVQRTYVVNGATYAAAYRSYSYGGVRYYAYAPVAYYHPAFYAWAFNPWVAPVHYGAVLWGWRGTPWFGVYGGFFAPYREYPMASLWLTDYLLAASLQAAYEAGLEAGAAGQGYQQGYPSGGTGQPPPDDYGAPPSYGDPVAGNQTQLSPEVKQAIADEVQQQLAAEQSAAANPQDLPTNDQGPDALNPAERVFVVGSSLDVVAVASNQECSLTAGDVLTRLDDTPDENQNVEASVQSSKRGECAAGQTVNVSVQALQEMHNQFRQKLDAGLKALAEKGGTGGLPKPPNTATTAGEVPTPTPDSAAADQLRAQQQQADQTEAQVRE